MTNYRTKQEEKQEEREHYNSQKTLIIPELSDEEIRDCLEKAVTYVKNQLEQIERDRYVSLESLYLPFTI